MGSRSTARHQKKIYDDLMQDEVHPQRGLAPDPKNIARYVVLRRLGEGAMGVVYSAYDPDLDRKVAIKIVREDSGLGTVGHNRIKQEAQAMAKVAHPNVVNVYEVGEYASPRGRSIFIAMEFVAGQSLEQWRIQHGRHTAASLDECLRLYLQAAAGLSAAHGSGLIHRDFKPSNVLLGNEGRVRVLDFGLARATGSSSDEDLNLSLPASAKEPPRSSRPRLTAVGTILGTPGYMAPEQIFGPEVDARSDQFSLCASLYEAIYHILPYGSDELEEYADSLLHSSLRPPPNRTGPVEVPLVVQSALRRGLSINPADRFPSMEALIAELSKGLRADADTQSARRLKQILVAVIATSLIVISASILWVQRGLPKSDLRPNMVMAWLFGGSMVGVFGLFYKKLLAQPRYRRLTQVLLLFSAYIVIGRTIGVRQGYPASSFLIQEMVGIAMLFVAEARFVGPKYLAVPALCFLSIALQIYLPEWRRVHLNIAYFLVVSLGAYWHLRGSAEDSK